MDTNLFVAFERHDTVDLLERAVTEHDVVLLCPSRVYTNDIAAFRGIERSLAEHGYEDRVELVKAFDFVESREQVPVSGVIPLPVQPGS